MLSLFQSSAKASQKPDSRPNNLNTSSRSEWLLASIRKRVGPILTALFTATAATGAMASEGSKSVDAIDEKWVKVVTPGIGPAEFAKTYFQSEDWDLLRDRSGRQVNPSTLVLGREYTLLRKTPARPEVHNIEKSIPKPEEAPREDHVRRTYDPVGEVISGTTPDEARRSGGEEAIITRRPTVVPQTKPIPAVQTKPTPTAQTKIQAKPTPAIQAKPKDSIKNPGPLSYSYDKLFGPSLGEWMGLNYNVYKEAVAKEESKKKGYYARNDAKGKKLGVSKWDWAWGKYQFTTATLEWLWIKLVEQGEISEKKVQAFLADAALQERLMVRYTKISIDKIRNNQSLASAVEAGEKSLPVLLAKGHIAGHGNIGKNLHKATDWSKTPVGKYAKLVEGHYFSLIAANDSGKKFASNTPDVPTSTASTVQNQTIATLTQVAPSVEQVAPKDVPAVNDAQYTPSTIGTIPSESAPPADWFKKTSAVVANAKGSVATIASLEAKFSRFWSDAEALTTYIRNHRNEAMRLKKLALTIVGPSREKFLKEAISHEKRALTLEAVLKWPPAGSGGLRKAA